MATVLKLFKVERAGKALVLTPQRELRELEHQEIAAELRPLLDDPEVRRVVVDFGHTDYFGSTALGLLTWLLRRVQERDGRMAFCNASVHEREILAVTGLAALWPIYSSREEALRAVAR